MSGRLSRRLCWCGRFLWIIGVASDEGIVYIKVCASCDLGPSEESEG